MGRLGSHEDIGAWGDIEQLYLLLHSRSHQRPMFLHRALRYRARRKGQNPPPGRRRRLYALDLLPTKLCTDTNSLESAACVRKQLVVVINDIVTDVCISRLACFLVHQDVTVGSVEHTLASSSVAVPGCIVRLAFDLDFFAGDIDARRWSLITYVYTASSTEPHSHCILDLSALNTNFIRHLPDRVLDLVLERRDNHPTNDRIQLQLTWRYSERSDQGSDPPPLPPPPKSSPTTVKYQIDSQERFCETLADDAGRCMLCGVACGDLDMLVVHLFCSHDRLRVRYRDNTLLIEPSRDPPDPANGPHHDFAIVDGRRAANSLTDDILERLRASLRDVTSSSFSSGRDSRDVLRRRSMKATTPSSSKKRRKMVVPVEHRVFHHSRSFVPLVISQIPKGTVDSDFEIDDKWVANQTDQTIAMFENVADDEKDLMLLWHSVERDYPYRITCETSIVDFCEHFARQLRTKSRSLRKTLVKHLLHLYQIRLLNSTQIRSILSIYDEDGKASSSSSSSSTVTTTMNSGDCAGSHAAA